MIAADRQMQTDFLSGTGEMGALIRDFDWKHTPLGPIEAWPSSLKTSVSLILNSRHPMWIGWGSEMTFLYNDAYLHVLGAAKHGRALGRAASEVWAEIWDVCGPLADKVFQKGEATFVDDVRLIMDRGDFLEETFYSFSYSPIRDESGRVCGLFCPSTDVTPRVVNTRRIQTLSQFATSGLAEKTTLRACAAAAQTLSANPDDIPFALLYLADATGTSASLEQTVGYLPAGVAVKTIDLSRASETGPWSVAEVYRADARRVVHVERVHGMPFAVADQPVSQAVVLPVTSRGQHNPYGVLIIGVNPCRPLDSDHLAFFDLIAGQVATSIQNARDIEEERKRADLLTEIDRAKTAFFSNVSHEFRTPLTLMLGPLESLLANPDGLTADGREHLAIAHRNSLRLLKLVNSLLDFSRVEAGRVQASFAPADLSALTADLASGFRSAMDAAGLRLIVDCAALPEPVCVDRDMWEKIVLNLLSNAFKFTFEGAVTVRVATDADGSHAILTVSDTGTGIPESELPRIFERFHRIEGAQGRTYEGTGIGLALTQELVKLHGGEISVVSRPGKGSAFTISLPFGSAHLSPALAAPKPGDKQARAEGLAVRSDAFTGEAMTWLSPAGRDQDASSDRRADRSTVDCSTARPRVLLADDNADMRDYITRILGDHYDLVVANDGHQALDILRRDPPDLLLTDIMMPGLDGFALLGAVRSDPATAALPVIFVSARAGEEMRVEGLEAGADDYLVKPFTANELRARVRAHVQMAIARRRAAEREAELRAEAEAARDRAVNVLESITDGFVALDRDWRITQVNAEAERLNGMRREDMLGKSHWDLFPAAVGTAIHRELLRAASERVPVDFENYYAPWSRWFHIKAYPGAEGSLSVFYEDITDRKAAEKRAKESERNFREMIDALPAAIYTTDSEGRLTHFNPAAVKLSGHIPELGTDRWCASWKLFLANGRPLPHDECPMAIALKGGAIDDGMECIAERPDGSRFWFTPYPTPLRDSEDRIVGGIHMLVDITARKMSEEALRRSEERFRGVFESSAVGVAILTLDYRFIQTNHAFSAITEYSAEQLSDLDYAGITHRDDRGVMENLTGQLISGEIPALVLEQRCSTKSGRTIWVNNSISIMRDAHGWPEYLILLSADVTSRKQAEADLRESEERFRAIVETSPDCVKLVAADGRLLLMNSAGLTMLGAGSAEALVGQCVFDVIAPEFRDVYRAFHETICGGEKGTLEFDVIGLTGHRRHLETRAAPLRQPDDTTVHLAVTHDVTERKMREREMKLLGAIVDSSDDAIVSKDLNGIVTSWNRGAERMFGYTAEEIVGESITLLVPPDRLSEEPGIPDRMSNDDRVDHFETVRRRKDGSLFDVSLTVSPVRDEHGRIVGISKIAHDLSQHRRAEKAIQELNAQLTFELSAMERIQRVSTRFVQADDFAELLDDIVEAGIGITGADMGVIQLLENDVLSIVSQRGFEAPFLDFFRVVQYGAAPRQAERVIVEDVATSALFDDDTRSVMLAAGALAVQSTPLINRSGQLVGMFSTHYRTLRRPGERELRLLDVLSRQAADLIERKRAETALLASESRFRQLADSMPQFVWTARPDGYIDYFNDRWYEFNGLVRGSLDDIGWRRAMNPDDHERTLAVWHEAVVTGEPFQIEYRFWDRVESRWRWFMGRALAVRDHAGIIVKWFGTCTDIDEQKHVEDELRRANQDLEQFAYSASHDLQEPLRSIKIYGELLTKRYGHKLDGQALDFLGYLRTGATRMEVLVRDLLTYTQVTRLDGPAEPADVDEALSGTLASLKGAIEESGASVTFGPLPSVRVHDIHLRQLFQNLIGNAIKYRKPDLPPLVHVSGERQNGSWVFSVRDNGIGIEPEYKEQVFGLFKRLHTSDEYSGTGIGLAICQRIVERYHGRIWVESPPGGGSDFRFSIPV